MFSYQDAIFEIKISSGFSFRVGLIYLLLKRLILLPNEKETRQKLNQIKYLLTLHERFWVFLFEKDQIRRKKEEQASSFRQYNSTESMSGAIQFSSHGLNLKLKQLKIETLFF